MRSVLISIQPKWCELIAAGSKTIEVRKTKPKLKTPFKVYIYCTKARNYFSCHGGIIEASDTLYKLPTGVIKCDSPFELQVDYEGQYDKNNFLNGKVIGEFVCDEIFEIEYQCGSYRCKGLTVLENDRVASASKLSLYDMRSYLSCNNGYGWQISDLVIYDKPRELSEFVVEGDCLNGDCKKCKWFDSGNDYNVEADCLLPYDFHFKKEVKPLFRPPQSWCYVESLGDAQ